MDCNKNNCKLSQIYRIINLNIFIFLLFLMSFGIYKINMIFIKSIYKLNFFLHSIKIYLLSYFNEYNKNINNKVNKDYCN